MIKVGKLQINEKRGVSKKVYFFPGCFFFYVLVGILQMSNL
ncbi:hypothetical protein CLOSTHATH_05030 [Hungatella hathewayi DSM 13479]|uniref:Uncharacterized protein n=1 Tax=Hungatella hathewayi DSM 13479 TaxID=566550 RepID=D3AN30_9FIRM|nr:hypothetical protein CLOSTHATH_05030 [Hungatella hathewayi DSM 13479]